MKLSIIVPIYKGGNDLEKYISTLKEFEGTDFEVIFVVNTNSGASLKIIDDHLSGTDIKVHIAFNSRRVKRNYAIIQGVQLATGDYIMVHTISYSFESEMVVKLMEEATRKKSDIIEFEPRFSKPIKWKSPLRKNFFEKVSIKDHQDVIAYTYFVLFNKIFKKELFIKAKNIKTMSKISNNHSIELLAKLFLVAETYSNMEYCPIKAKHYITQFYNPLIIIEEFELIFSSDIYKDYQTEIGYNKYFTEVILFLSLLGGFGNKEKLNKYLEKIQCLYNEPKFFQANKYFLKNTPETTLLKESQNEYSTKTYKAFYANK